MHDFGPEQPSRIVTELRDYWNSLRQGRAVPNRSDVDPRGIRRALDYAFIIERIAPGAARFRLAGRHLIDLMGMEVRGMPVCSFLNPASRGQLSDVLETVFKAPQIADLHLQAGSDYARPHLKARMLFLPLKSDLGDVTRALGCLISEGDIGIAPRRFDLAHAEVNAIFDGAKPMQPSPSARGFGEEAQGWRGNKATRERTQAQATPAASAETPEERRARFKVIGRDS
ncbi:PAS domain-containing protein [Paracoccus sp. TK19116]|uniref:PAS domain-containing protein n=1 Tax=Paracoccus albicereus TaxID=2922394 RepID=A0ABT1MP19_9RHOB|nr:PAS domain-containing protein [Paracoccus albicereus]MCQ0970035.1 PAS domain-containing protein [Paracoccus albicereus]